MTAVAVGPERPTPWAAMGLAAVAVVALLIGLGLVGELGAFITAGFNVLPFVGLAVLAALGETRRWARWLTYCYLVALGLGVLGLSALFAFMAQAGPLTAGAPVAPDQAMAGLRLVLVYLAVGLVLLLAALLALLPAVRARVARWLPLRPESTMNAAALSAALMLASLPVAMLVVLGGWPPLLTLMTLPGMENVTTRPLDLIYGLVWMMPASLVLVGYPIRRGFRATLVRLGLVTPTWRQAVIGVAAGGALVLVAAFVLDPGIAWLWGQFGWPRTDAQAFERLMAGLITPLGAAVVGITAGLGEEAAVRGVLQPRIGIVLANLAFTAAHSYQYSFDGLLTVFLIGTALGVVRARTNTSTSAIAHGVYNFTLILVSALGS